MSQKKIDYYSLTFEEERQIAVEMWEYIKRELKRHSNSEVWELKDKFIKKTFLMNKEHYQRYVWYNDCMLCDVSPSCKSCPLSRMDLGLDCGDTGSIYNRVCNRREPLETRLECCDTVIKAIRMAECRR